MMTLTERIDTCVQLGNALKMNSPELLQAYAKAKNDNVWFDLNNCALAIHNITHQFLDESKLKDWTSRYSMTEPIPKSVGLIMAGNLPLVGFHDVLAIFISGHYCKLKLSQKDTALWNYIIELFYSLDERTKDYIEIKERLNDIDAAIATGSDNTSRYFDYYFGKYPHIIRKNRVGVGVLTGDESEVDMLALGNDAFQYFGLGCRNISTLLVPRGYDFIPLLKCWEAFIPLKDNHAYCNNYDYNYAIYLMNQTPFLANGAVILLESNELVSRLACLNYQYYDQLSDIDLILTTSASSIQTIVCHRSITGFNVTTPGETQCPSLYEYADGVDTMQFLLTL